MGLQLAAHQFAFYGPRPHFKIIYTQNEITQ